MQKNLEGFIGGWASEEDTAKAIDQVYKESNYVIDTHTAVAASVYHRYVNDTKDETKTVVVSTASPYKFAKSVLTSLHVPNIPEDDYEQAILLEKASGAAIPKAVEEIRTAPVVHKKVCETSKMQAIVEEILKII